MDMPNSMEHIVVTQFIESLPVVLKPCHVNQPFIPRLLRTMKEIICDRSRSTLILRVLVEATTPLAKFGVGLCTAESLENDLKVCRLILKDCGPSSSAQYVMPVETIQELTDLADLLKSDSLHTPPLTPTSPNDDDDIFCLPVQNFENTPALDSSPVPLTPTSQIEEGSLSNPVQNCSKDRPGPESMPTPLTPEEEDVFSLPVKDIAAPESPEKSSDSQSMSAFKDTPHTPTSPYEEDVFSLPVKDIAAPEIPEKSLDSQSMSAVKDSPTPHTPTSPYENVFSLPVSAAVKDSPAPLTPTSPYVISFPVETHYKGRPAPVDLVKNGPSVRSTENQYLYTPEQLQSYRHDRCNIKLPMIAYVLGIVRELCEVGKCPAQPSSSSQPKHEVVHKSSTLRDNVCSRRPPLLSRGQSAEFNNGGSTTSRHNDIATVKHRSASLSDVPRYYDEQQANQARYRSKSRAGIMGRWEHDMFDPNQ